jgi:hypothetical protein
VAFSPADQKTRQMAEKELPPSTLKRYSAEGKLQLETFVVYGYIISS